MPAPPITRRTFLEGAAGCCAAGVLAASRGFAAAAGLQGKIGYSTIAWPEAEFEHALQTVAELGFKGVQLVGWARDRYGNRAQELRNKLKTLKLAAVAQSCWGVRLDPGDPSDDTETFRAYARFFRSLGGSFLQVTDQGKPDGEYSEEIIGRLGAKMNDLGRIAQDHGLELGYHPHLGSFGETEDGVARIFAATDAKLVKLIADTAHLYLGGMDPAAMIRKYRSRLIQIHLKDARKDAAAVRGDRSLLQKCKYLFCEVGQGALDFPAIRSALEEIQFQGWTIVELDGNEPAPGGPDESARINRRALQKLGW